MATGGVTVGCSYENVASGSIHQQFSMTDRVQSKPLIHPHKILQPISYVIMIVTKIVGLPEKLFALFLKHKIWYTHRKSCNRYWGTSDLTFGDLYMLI